VQSTLSVTSGEPRAGFGIAFEGCGCRAAFHVGAIEWFVEHDLLPAAVAGASSGALIAAATAVGRVAELRPVWTGLFGSRVCDLRRLLRGRWPFRMSEIVGGAATRYFGDRLLADTRIPISIVVTQLGRSGFTRRALTARSGAAGDGDPRLLLPPGAVLTTVSATKKAKWPSGSQSRGEGGNSSD
jgi:predicted acylesterase/phospholipase RssA